MGRRKIEIKAIKDDRNRSVTFLKRKGGLFKKAHELSVLCSVDVAVVIFGNNKKLYEYSSSDMGEILQRYNFYGGPHEHKGPADFNGRKDDDDDDEDDMGTPPSHHSQEPQMMPPQFQNQSGFQHIRHITPSASPPIPNGAFQHQHVQRQHTPQPPMGSRPSSRNAPHRHTSNLGPQHMSQPPPPINGYAYMPQPTIYNSQNGPMMPQHGHPPMQQPLPTFQYPGPPAQHHLQQVYMEEQRRSSMPPTFPQQERHAPGPSATPPQPQQQQLPRHIPQQPPQQAEPQQHQSQPQQTMLEPPVKRLSVKSRSIFTPIDESRSILSQHWASSTSAAEVSQSDPAAVNRSQSVDVGSVARNNAPGPPSPLPPRAQAHEKNRNTSISSNIDTFTPPSRTNSAQLGAKRPRLKVQIPDEPSDGGGSATADSSPRGSTDATGSHPSRRGADGSQSSGVVLPPPSPSASALLSAGAAGPPNPFARPHPPNQNTQANGDRDRDRERNDKMDTPVSALPSRFMNNEFLPSPSSFFYPEWNMRGGDMNTLPSPLNFATPVVGFGASFLREDSSGAGGPSKRKSPEADGGGDVKRVKHEP